MLWHPLRSYHETQEPCGGLEVLVPAIYELIAIRNGAEKK